MEPYDIYSKLSFNIIIGHFGDCYDRYLIRINEMKESVRIILQCIELIHFIDTNVSKFNFFMILMLIIIKSLIKIDIIRNYLWKI